MDPLSDAEQRMFGLPRDLASKPSYRSELTGLHCLTGVRLRRGGNFA